MKCGKKPNSARKSAALRRLLAFLLAVSALGMAGMAGGGGLLRQLAAALCSDQLSQRVLSQELGAATWEEGLDPTSQAVVEASPLLAAGVILEADENEEVVEPEALALETAPAETEEPAETQAPVEETQPAQTTAPVTEATITTATGENALNLDAISLTNRAGVELDLGEIAALDCTLDLSGEPQILIMHTHGTEAYTPDGEDVYQASDNYRTTDENYNMIRVGNELAQTLTDLGFSVAHDTTLYDYPSYTGSYSRAKEGIAWWLEQYPSITMVLDVHRDALIAEDGTASKVITTVNGEKTAQVMLVVGTDAGGLTHPNWRTNLALALRVQQALLDIDPTFPRPINLRSSRFNQHMTAGSLLVEVGSCGNTLQEALGGVRLFGEALGEVLNGMR